MSIIILGTNHKTAPIAIREKVAFSPRTLSQALQALKGCDCIEEGLILSTCNRTEIYAAAKDIFTGLNAVKDFLSRFHQIPGDEIADYLYSFCEKEAVRHLFRVASSLDSMIIGETQIFGQVKEAYFNARQANSIGKSLDLLFEEAIRTGKKVRTQTQIGKGAVSTSTAAIELARKIFESLEGRRVLIIGAGKIGELTVKNLYSRGVSAVLVANRTWQKAEELAAAFGGKAVRFEKILEELENSDIVISSTSANHYLVRAEDIRRLMQKRKNAPLFLIDLGLPRNIDPQIERLDNVYLYNIDDLAGVADANIKERQREARKAEEIILGAVEAASSRLKAKDKPAELILK